MTALASLEYPHWLIIGGVLLLVLGFVGLAWGHRGAAESPPDASEEKPEPEADIDQVEVYNRTAKEKRRDRWAERIGDSEEPVTSGEKLGQGSE